MHSLALNADTVGIRGIRAYGRHGASSAERERPQPLDIDVELRLDLTLARRSDELSDTVDYAHVHERVVELVEKTSFRLLEGLGEALVRMLLRDARVLSARVCLSKPNLLNGATPWIAVSLRRGEEA